MYHFKAPPSSHYLMYDVIITKDTVATICFTASCHRYACGKRYLMTHGLREALLKSDSSSVTGPPRVVVHRPAAEAHLFHSVEF